MGHAQTVARPVDVMTTAILGPEASIGDKVAFLRAMPGVVQVIETHMAFVFLTADFAFKLKKPARFGYFDHRALAARATACAEEVRLNRALAGDVYIGMVPVVQAGARLALGGGGTVVDWLVHMRRLPAERMLDRLISNGQGPSEAETAAVVTLLTRFYRRQQTLRPPAGQYFAHLIREQTVNAENLHQMARYLPGVPLAQVTSGLAARIARMEPEIAAREAAGLVIEGHGDLRPEHLCLTNPPVIFDRVETAQELRVTDIFDEVGYLAAECTLMGRPDIATGLMTGLQDAGFAPPTPALQATYAMFRLVTRARLALDHLRDPDPATPAKWPARARDYLTEAIRLSPSPLAGGHGGG
jgi:uncharacterized protein